MLLADMGADVIRIDRPSTGHDLGISVPRQYSVLLRNRRSIPVDLNQARCTFIDVDGIVQPAPAPRFSATPTTIPVAPTASGTHTDEIMRSSGYDDGEIAELQQAGIIGGAGRQ